MTMRLAQMMDRGNNPFDRMLEVQTLLDDAISKGTVDPNFYQAWEVRDQIATLLATRELENSGVVVD